MSSNIKSIIEKIARRTAELNYYTARAYHTFMLERSRRMFSGPPLLIYQMGKVGSTTILRSLEDLKLDMPIYHIHGLSREYIAMKEKDSKKYFGTNESRFIDMKAPWVSKYLRKRTLENINGQKCRIISLVREPVIRKISSFFQRIGSVELRDGGSSYTIRSYIDEYELTGSMNDMEALTNLFLGICKREAHNDRAMYWFDLEFKGVLGVDIFASEFPRSRGYKIYNERLADILLLRLENLNECCEQAFKEFMGIDGFSLSNTNVGREKSYAPIYRAFINSVVLPQSFLDEMYNTRYVKHFYSEEEINNFKARWQNVNKRP